MALQKRSIFNLSLSFRSTHLSTLPAGSDVPSLSPGGHRQRLPGEVYELCLSRHSWQSRLDTKKGNPTGSFLATVSQTAYKTGCTPRSTPPIQFEYSAAKIQGQVREVDADSLINLPTGLDGTRYQWVDLDGEGIPGILSEQANAWLYKRNVSPISIVKENDVTRYAATFSAMEVVAKKPAFASTGTGGWQFQNLAGEGKVDLARFEGAVPGFFERNENEEDNWDNFVAFRALPNVNWHDPNLRFVDLTGDGSPTS